MKLSLSKGKFFELWFLIFPLIFLIPVGLSTTFMQNDDWVHYRTVERFLSGNFTLEPIIGSTFYTQGLLGTIFASLFGLSSLPVLTAIISSLNFYILFLILHKRLSIQASKSFLFSLFLLFNPLYFYSSIGFMTENYFIFFLLLTTYFFLKFVKKQNYLIFILLNIFAICGFFVKQSFLVVIIGLAIMFFLKKTYRFLFAEISILLGLSGFYFKVFPMTEIMKSQSIALENLVSIRESSFFLFAILIYFVAFMSPIFFFYAIKTFRSLTFKSKILSIIMAILIYYIAGIILSKSENFLNIFPYLTNTFDRKGFYTYGLSGNKYHWKGFYDVFEYWIIFSKLILSFFISQVLFNIKSFKLYKISFPLIVMMTYVVLLLMNSKSNYDRYLLPFYPMILIIFAKELKSRLALLSVIIFGVFLIFLGYLNYSYAMDYIGWQNYVWKKSESIGSQSIIQSSHAWNGYYGSVNNPEYFFTFDSPNTLSNSRYNLIETHIVNFPLNPFINPNIYLYKLK